MKVGERLDDDACTESRPRVRRAGVVIWSGASILLVVFAVLALIREDWVGAVIALLFAFGMILTAVKTFRSGLPHSFMTALMTRWDFPAWPPGSSSGKPVDRVRLGVERHVA